MRQHDFSSCLTLCKLGLIYFDGRGVERDCATTLSWFSKAAVQGPPGANHHIGLMYENGLGVEGGHAKAHAWFTRAAERGHVEARSRLGELGPGE